MKLRRKPSLEMYWNILGDLPMCLRRIREKIQHTPAGPLHLHLPDLPDKKK